MATTAPRRGLSLFSVAPAFNIFLGVWIVGMSYFLQFTAYHNALIMATAVGFFIILFAITRLAVSPAYFWAGWINVALGAVIAATPFLLGLTAVNDIMIAFIASGVAVMVFALLGQFEKTS